MSSSDSRLVADDLVLDVRGREVTRGGLPLVVKPREFDLLFFFVQHSGETLSRDVLLREVWGSSVAVPSRTVDVHVRWIRSKIEVQPHRPVRLVTVRGVGYKWIS